jgi:hypothetical protein
LRGVPGWVLKGSAVCLTVLATVGSAGYVGAHVKNGGAPLRPSLQPEAGAQSSGPGPGSVPPGMLSAGSQPVTDTHVS